MERVREVGAETAGLGEDGVERARHALMREIDRAGRPGAATVRSHRGRWIGGSALVGGLAAAALVVGVVVVPAGAPSAQAAEVLERAAAATLTTTAITPAPGEYIRIQEIEEYLVGWNESPDEPEGWWAPGTGDTTATVRVARSLYVPADRTGVWAREYGESREVVEVVGPHAGPTAEELADVGASDGIEVYPAGMYAVTGVEAEGVQADDVHTFAVDGLSCYTEAMPRDPEALVAWLDGYQHEYLSDCAPPRLTEPTDFNLAPADLRAAMFRAMALLDGARVVGSEGDVTTIAIPDGGESDWMETVAVDTTTGLMVGRGTLDAGDWSSRVAVSIVDALPADVADAVAGGASEPSPSG